MATYQAGIYPENTDNPTVVNADASRKSIGICFSGGGSRAFTCAWGQLIGLYNMKDQNGTRLLDQVRYISSVSGGTWASSLYTFHPENISDDVFLGAGYAPGQLYYDSNVADSKNVSIMSPDALGHIPQNFDNLMDFDIVTNIVTEFLLLSWVLKVPLNESLKWIWMFIVGTDVLADYGLYNYTFIPFSKDLPWNYADAKFFSLSETYAGKHIFNGQQPPPQDSFIYTRTQPDGVPATPMLVINTNIVGDSKPGVDMSEVMQIPVQASPVATGIYGANSCVPTDAVGGGLTESFSFTSTLMSQPAQDRASANFSRTYALADIVSCSSAFFAKSLAPKITQSHAKLKALSDSDLQDVLASFTGKYPELGKLQLDIADFRTHLSGLQQEAELTVAPSDLVPQYNYWPVSDTVSNTNTFFTDGGAMDNTGVAGLLAQTQGTLRNIVAFANGTDYPQLVDDRIVAARQMAPLFGMAFDGTSAFEKYQPNGINPFTGKTDPIGFLHVFDNADGQFDALQKGLYKASNSGACTDPVFFLQTLTTVDNTLMGIKASSDTINVLWIQNTRMYNWQDQIKDPVLKQKILEGQKHDGIIQIAEFANFPYYDTFQKINLNAAETNTLAQMWAWATADTQSPLNPVIRKMFTEAGN